MTKIIHSETEQLFVTLTQKGKVKKYLDLLENHHKETYEHSLRVGLLSLDLGYDNDIRDTELSFLGYAGLLHDLGKIRVPTEILSKPTSLDTLEEATMRGHLRLGFLELNDPEYEIVKQIIVAHHEYKRNPYPRTGEDRRRTSQIPRCTEERRKINKRISILAQIVSVTDMYDALVSRRYYKAPFLKEEVEDILRNQFTGDNQYIDQILRRYDLS